MAGAWKRAPSPWSGPVDVPAQLGVCLVLAELVDRGLGGAERESGAADAALDHVLTHFLDHRFGAELLHLVQGHTLDHLGDDRAACLADGAALAFERCLLDATVVVDLEVNGDQVAAAGIAAAELDVGVVHAAFVPRVLEMIQDVFDVLAAVHTIPSSLFFRPLYERSDTRTRAYRCTVLRRNVG